MKKSLLILAALFTLFACGGNETPGPDPVPETPVVGPEDALDFARGADISWASEMVAGGVKFRKKDGTVAESTVDNVRIANDTVKGGRFTLTVPVEGLTKSYLFLEGEGCPNHLMTIWLRPGVDVKVTGTD